jgi:UDP-N-acetyl-D-mannosaminuronic acid transferase (WecB/TagA/CpsF family)
MSAKSLLSQADGPYRNILGLRFFVGNASDAVSKGSQAGLVVAPSAPGLVTLSRDSDYRQALEQADLVITDSGFLVLLWNLMTADRITRVSGLAYLRLLLARSEFKQTGTTLWVMPSAKAAERNLAWLRANGYPVEPSDCYIAPQYPPSDICDPKLLDLVNRRQPQHLIICIGGGIQEKLGLYLKRNGTGRPAIHCIGAAIGFLTGDQVPIPPWADQKVLGWLLRCVSNPQRFVPRYARALQLPILLWRYRSRMPDLSA